MLACRPPALLGVLCARFSDSRHCWEPRRCGRRRAPAEARARARARRNNCLPAAAESCKKGTLKVDLQALTVGVAVVSMGAWLAGARAALLQDAAAPLDASRKLAVVNGLGEHSRAQARPRVFYLTPGRRWLLPSGRPAALHGRPYAPRTGGRNLPAERGRRAARRGAAAPSGRRGPRRATRRRSRRRWARACWAARRPFGWCRTTAARGAWRRPRSRCASGSSPTRSSATSRSCSPAAPGRRRARGPGLRVCVAGEGDRASAAPPPLVCGARACAQGAAASAAHCEREYLLRRGRSKRVQPGGARVC